MFSSHFKRTLVILAAVAVLCLGVAHFAPNFAGSVAARGVHEVLAPAQDKMMLAWRSGGSFLGYFASVRRLQDENNQLKQQLSNQIWENDRLREYVYENQRLQKLLEFKQRNDLRFTLLGARVISRSPSNWYNTMVVDRGSGDGVKKDMVVVSDAGLVGRVDAVGPHTAEVLLILDREGAVGVMVSESGTQGVIEGNKEDPGVLRMIDLPYDANLTPGQTVVTSGLGGIFPQDVPIGQVLKFNKGGSDLDMYALVQPYVDFNRLQDVFIITETRSVPQSGASPGNSQPLTAPVLQVAQ
ncbi:MAG: rod shape-determining protein MreC [Thermacetogeniaceae bacterium]